MLLTNLERRTSESGKFFPSEAKGIFRLLYFDEYSKQSLIEHNGKLN